MKDITNLQQRDIPLLEGDLPADTYNKIMSASSAACKFCKGSKIFVTETVEFPSFAKVTISMRMTSKGGELAQIDTCLLVDPIAEASGYSVTGFLTKRAKELVQKVKDRDIEDSIVPSRNGSPIPFKKFEL